MFSQIFLSQKEDKIIFEHMFPYKECSHNNAMVNRILARKAVILLSNTLNQGIDGKGQKNYILIQEAWA